MKDYSDIINLPRHRSKKHPHMSMLDRAAQFSPFMALVGYGDEVEEAQRLVEERIELDENEKEILNEKLLIISENLSERPRVAVTYFEPDLKKAGGAYVTISGNVKKISEYDKTITMEDGRVISIEDIRAVEI